MTFLEFVVAASIAFYVMIGSALLSAAITSPRNCLIAISGAWQGVRAFWIIGCAAFLLALVVRTLGAWDFGVFPLGTMTAANTAAVALLLLARGLAMRILDERPAQDSEREHEGGPEENAKRDPGEV